MKVHKEELPIPESFSPFKLTCTVESREEAQALYAIFNYSPNLDLLPHSGQGIRDTIGDQYKVNYSDIIANNISYSRFYRSKA